MKVVQSTSHNLISIVKIATFIICWSIFIFQTVTLIMDYLSEITTTTMSFTTEEELSLPVLVACPMQSFRNPNSEFMTLEDFRNQTFSMEEVITVEEPEKWIMRDFVSSVFDRCFYFEYIEKVKALEVAKMHPKTPMRLFLIEPGEEIWLISGFFPLSITHIDINMESNIFSDVHLSVKRTELLKSCRYYEGGDSFSKCWNNIFAEEAQKEMTCFTPRLQVSTYLS